MKNSFPTNSGLLATVRRRGAHRRRGLTLLEAILAVAILGMAMASLGTLVTIGARSAEKARDGTTAQLICESVMSQVVSGALPAEAVGLSQYFEDEPLWLYSVAIQPIPQTGTAELPLIEVRVLVQQSPDLSVQPIVYEMVRWMPDPTIVGVSQEETTEDAPFNGGALMIFPFSHSIPLSGGESRRSAYTLLELLLALALSALIMMAIGLALDLHLRSLERHRGQLEEAQLARAILRHIANDLRGAVRYEPPDLSGAMGVRRWRQRCRHVFIGWRRRWHRRWWNWR